MRRECPRLFFSLFDKRCTAFPPFAVFPRKTTADISAGTTCGPISSIVNISADAFILRGQFQKALSPCLLVRWLTINGHHLSFDVSEFQTSQNNPLKTIPLVSSSGRSSRWSDFTGRNRSRSNQNRLRLPVFVNLLLEAMEERSNICDFFAGVWTAL